MLESIIQNFNWPTFLIAFGAFILLSNLIGLINAIIRNKRAKHNLNRVESKYNELKAQLKAKDDEYNRILGKKENK